MARELSLAGAIYRTFSSDAGRVTLQWILRECGFFETDPARIDPSRLALAHRLLRAGSFAIAGDSGRFTRAIVDSHDAEGDYEDTDNS